MNLAAAGALIVFARAPRPGRVKTRLAATLGAAKATDIYAGLLDRALTLARHSAFAQRHLFCAATDERDYFNTRLGHSGWRVHVQSGADLGARMFNAFDTVLAEASFVVLTGSDIADSTPEDLKQAHQVLVSDRKHAVLGPVADGGYWLLGLAQVQRTYFADIAWGTGGVAASTTLRLQRDGLLVHRLAERHDVDVAEDTVFLDRQCGGTRLDAD